MNDLFDDLPDEGFESSSNPSFETVETSSPSFDDDLDQLRDRTTRTSSTYDEMDMSLDEFDSGGGFSFSSFSTSQKLILLALLLLDIVAIGFGLLVVLGRI